MGKTNRYQVQFVEVECHPNHEAKESPADHQKPGIHTAGATCVWYVLAAGQSAPAGCKSADVEISEGASVYNPPSIYRNRRVAGKTQLAGLSKEATAQQ